MQEISESRVLFQAPRPPAGAIPSDHVLQLSPMQRLYLHLQPDATRCFDQCFFLKLNKKIRYKYIFKALETIVRRHRILRARFSKNKEGTWEQRITNDVLESFCIEVYHSAGSKTAEIIAQCREGLDIESGPLLAAILFDGAEGQTLFLTIHHLVVDLVSWRVLFQELEELLTSGTITTPPSIGFQTWSTLQAHMPSKTRIQPLRLRLKSNLLFCLIGEWKIVLTYKAAPSTKDLLSTSPPPRCFLAAVTMSSGHVLSSS